MRKLQTRSKNPNQAQTTLTEPLHMSNTVNFWSNNTNHYHNVQDQQPLTHNMQSFAGAAAAAQWQRSGGSSAAAAAAAAAQWQRSGSSGWQSLRVSKGGSAAAAVAATAAVMAAAAAAAAQRQRRPAEHPRQPEKSESAVATGSRSKSNNKTKHKKIADPLTVWLWKNIFDWYGC